MTHSFESIISIENLLAAWNEFIKGKRRKKDVIYFQLHLMDDIIQLHNELENKIYKHGNYEAFKINDPKPRNIHKASVRDRLLHRAVYRMLYPFFDRTFIADSYSCRDDKGVHKALKRFCALTYRVSKNHTRTCWVLKCDIKKFFASIDHKILLDILCKYIPDKNVLWLLKNIIESFPAGLPLGNLTSQLFTNICMNVFDQWVKHSLKVGFYIRYADDFVIFSSDKVLLKSIIPQIKEFLFEKLKLTLHHDKIFLETIASGVDFLGWINFPNHRILRKTTKRRMLNRMRSNPTSESLQSYLGLLRHGNTQKIQLELLGQYWL